MFYEEEIINGILCYRLTPRGKFIECDIKSLSRRVKEQSTKIKSLNNKIEAIKELAKEY